MANDFAGYAGIDWASETHRVCVLDDRGRIMGERDVAHDGGNLAEMCGWLVETTGASPDRLAVAIETPRGPVVEILLERGFAVHAINPKQLDRFRDRFTVAGAKDDSRDAYVLAHSLVTDRHAYRRLAVDDPLIIELREWSRLAEDLRDEHGRLASRMRGQLWRYYPQMLELADGDVATEWLLELWEEAPTPAKAAQLPVATIEQILKSHRIRRIDAAEVLRVLNRKPLAVAPGTVPAAIAHIRILIQRIRLVDQQIKQAHRRLDALCKALQQPGGDDAGNRPEQRDVKILRSLPGIGRINLATLLAEACEPLRRRDYHVLRALSGQAPVTRRSGKTRIVIQRYACNQRLKNALYHWSRVAVHAIPQAGSAMPPCAGAVTAMAAPCERWVIACWRSPVSCSSARSSSIRIISANRRLQHDPIPLFDRNGHPFVPTCLPAERRAQALSRMPPAAPAKPARSVLDWASTVLQSIIVGPSRFTCGVTAPQ